MKNKELSLVEINYLVARHVYGYPKNRIEKRRDYVVCTNTHMSGERYRFLMAAGEYDGVFGVDGILHTLNKRDFEWRIEPEKDTGEYKVSVWFKFDFWHDTPPECVPTLGYIYTDKSITKAVCIAAVMAVKDWEESCGKCC